MRAAARIAVVLILTIGICPDRGQTGNVTGLQLPPEIHAVALRGIAAHYGGRNVYEDVPLRYSVEALWFTFEGDSRVYLFKPKGELFFSDWSFDLFSPDGTHVLLLQDRYGPYHVVAIDRLKNYLAGRAKPNYVVTDERRGRSDPAEVHYDGRWISSTEIEFTVGCCGTHQTLSYRLGQKSARPKGPLQQDVPRMGRH